MGDVAARLAEIVGDKNLLTGEAISEDYAHDEALTAEPQKPAYVAKPATAEEVAELLKVASEHNVPVTARGSGSGLSGAARPREDGLLISFERMNAVLEVDTGNHVAVVQPGVTLAELDAKTAEAGLSYTVYPGELSASVGGNVGTNAGGMRAVKYGVTRNNVLGLQAVLPTGEIIRTGGKIVEGLHRLRPDPADHRLRRHPRAGHRDHRQAAPAARRTAPPCSPRSATSAR